MNRKIKFRGKRIDNGEWVYGYYVVDPVGEHRIYWKPPYEATSNPYRFVFAETVGQFTGLHDKNGKYIFEGDILTVSYPRIAIEEQLQSKIGVVEFLDTLPAFCVMRNKFPNCKTVSSFNNTGEQWEVIGNIHDNPELLKTE